MEFDKTLCKFMLGDIQYIEQFIKKNPNKLNNTNNYGATILHFASVKGEKNIVSMFLKAGVNFTLADNDGNTPLHWAAVNNQYEVVALLLSDGANINTLNKNGYSPLHQAILNNHKEVVSVVLHTTCSHTVQINQRDPNGNTPLHMACKGGNSDMVRVLCTAKPNVNVVDMFGYTPLHVACLRGYRRIVELLLKSKADLNVLAKDEYTPLHLSCYYGHRSIVECLLKSNTDVNVVGMARRTPLHVACLNGHSGTVNVLLRSKPNVNVLNEDGNTPLHLACERGHYATIKVLLPSKPDVNVVTMDGNTLLHVAVLQNHYDILALILSQDQVQLDIGDSLQRTPLLLAVAKGHLGMVHILVSKGADVNTEDKHGNNCLHLALKIKKFHSESEHIDALDEICSQLSLSKEDRLSGIVVGCYIAKKGANLYHRNHNNVTTLDSIEDSSLKEKLKKYVSTRYECMLCWNNQATVKLTPCGHTVTCQECYSKIEIRKCMQCRQPVTQNKIDESYVQDKYTCAVCLDQRYNMVFQCGHTICRECGTKLTNCHMCRKPIMKRINIY